MNAAKLTILIISIFLISTNLEAQIVVKMDMPKQSDHPLSVVTLFDEEIPEGIPMVLGVMGYDIIGGKSPYIFEWLLNGIVISTNDVAIFTPKKGDDLSLKITDNNKCTVTSSFNLKVGRIPSNPDSKDDKSIQVFPTVVTDHINIELPKGTDEQALVRIYNINGEIVHQENIAEDKLIMIKLNAGTYFVSVKMGVIHKVEKIMSK